MFYIFFVIKIISGGIIEYNTVVITTIPSSKLPPQIKVKQISNNSVGNKEKESLVFISDLGSLFESGLKIRSKLPDLKKSLANI